MSAKSYGQVVETLSAIVIVLAVLAVLAGFARLLSNNIGFLVPIALVAAGSVYVYRKAGR